MKLFNSNFKKDYINQLSSEYSSDSSSDKDKKGDVRDKKDETDVNRMERKAHNQEALDQMVK